MTGSVNPYFWLAHKPNADVPAFGVMVDNGADWDDGQTALVLNTRTMQTLGERPIYVNSPSKCASGGNGTCYIPNEIPGYVAYDSTDGTPAEGETWGPEVGNFKIRKGNDGFKILQAGVNGIAWAVYKPTAGGGGAWIEFTPTQTFSTSDAAFSATVSVVHGNVPDAVSATVTINNTQLAFSGNTSSLGICANYDAATDAYYCIQLGCPPAT